MRKKLLIISLLATIALGGNAQMSDIRFGVKVAPTFDWASSGSNMVKNDGLRMGFNAGLVVEYAVTEQIAVSSGINFNFLRMKYTFTDYRFVDDFLEQTNVAVNRKVNATVVEIPLKAKVGYEVMDLFKAYFEAGLGLGFNTKDNVNDKYSYFWVTSDRDTYVNRTDQYRLLQASMIVGLGAEYEISAGLSAFAQLSVDHSFSNAFAHALAKQSGSIVRNNFIGIELGVLF